MIPEMRSLLTGTVMLMCGNTPPQFPDTANAFRRRMGQLSRGKCFVTKLDSTGSTLAYSTFLGGNCDSLRRE